MSQNTDSLLVTVTLSEPNWKAILEILQIACRLRGSDWVRWEREMERTVLDAVQKTMTVTERPTSPNRQRDEWDNPYLSYDEVYGALGDDELSDLLQSMEDGEPYDLGGYIGD